MKPAAWRLVLAATLFVCWIGWLVYLVASSKHPADVLSRPQFLASTLDVIASVREGKNGPDPQVTVRQVVWPPGEANDLEGREITVTNLAFCEGWAGPGDYILPLVKDGKNYRVASIPRSPGYDPETGAGRPRIYPATRETRDQLQRLPKPALSPQSEQDDRPRQQ